jgi:hypothetical protein
MRSPSFIFDGDVDPPDSAQAPVSYVCPQDRPLSQARIATRRILPSGCVLLSMSPPPEAGSFFTSPRSRRKVGSRGY